MHQGLFRLSPSEFFFGRKAFENIEYIQNIGELYIPSVSEESYAAWKERVKNLRNDAESRQKLSRDKMVSRNGNKFPSSVYELGEKVLVKMKISDKKIRGKHKICDIIKGKIVNRKETRYEVNYIDKKGKDRSDWFPVSAITSVTRTIEKERKRKAITAKPKPVDQFEEKTVQRCQVKPAEQFLEKPVLQCEEKAQDRCGRKSGDLCEKELTYKNKVKLRSGTVKRKKTSILDIEENAEIEKVIRLSRRVAPKGANIENLEKKLLFRNLRIVDVLGDGNFFFRALSYQLFGDAEAIRLYARLQQIKFYVTQNYIQNP